jgi:predicted amidohydrolase YtcJ
MTPTLDVLIRNAKVLTMDDRRPVAGTIGIRGGDIVLVDGPTDGYDAARVIDAGGRVVLPGFHDAHCHTGWYGLSRAEVDLGGVSSMNEVYAALRGRAEALDAGEWVLAAGFNHLDLDGLFPDLAVLDALAPHQPVFIRHNSGHACIVNTAALRAAGLPADGDGATRHVLREQEQQAIQDLFMPYAHAAIVDALDVATQQYAAEGITSFTEAGVGGGWIGRSPIELAAYQTARDRGGLHARAQLMVALDALHPISGHRDDPHRLGLDLGIRTGFGDEWLSIGPAKVFVDGSLLGLTAAMTDDYCSGPAHNHGALEGDADQLAARILAAHAAGWSIAAHAIGDVGVGLAVDVLEEALRRDGPRRVPNRIEHGGVVPDSLLARATAAGVVIVPQPGFIPSFGDDMARALGADRVRQSYRARTQLEAGMTLPGSSDRPVAEGAPLRNIQAFVERRCASGSVYGPAERLTVEQALRAYTRGSAEATGSDARRGRVAVGQVADLVMLDRDPFEVPASGLADIAVEMTLLGGAASFVR